jgi:hypothetical protein
VKPTLRLSHVQLYRFADTLLGAEDGKGTLDRQQRSTDQPGTQQKQQTSSHTSKPTVNPFNVRDEDSILAAGLLQQPGLAAAEHPASSDAALAAKQLHLSAAEQQQTFTSALELQQRIRAADTEQQQQQQQQQTGSSSGVGDKETLTSGVQQTSSNAEENEQRFATAEETQPLTISEEHQTSPAAQLQSSISSRGSAGEQATSSVAEQLVSSHTEEEQQRFPTAEETQPPTIPEDNQQQQQQPLSAAAFQVGSSSAEEEQQPASAVEEQQTSSNAGQWEQPFTVGEECSAEMLSGEEQQQQQQQQQQRPWETSTAEEREIFTAEEQPSFYTEQQQQQQQQQQEEAASTAPAINQQQQQQSATAAAPSLAGRSCLLIAQRPTPLISETAQLLLRQGAQVTLALRHPQDSQLLANSIIRHMPQHAGSLLHAQTPLNFGSQASVRGFAAALNASPASVDLLLLHGAEGGSGKRRWYTAEGISGAAQVNSLMHACGEQACMRRGTLSVSVFRGCVLHHCCLRHAVCGLGGQSVLILRSLLYRTRSELIAHADAIAISSLRVHCHQWCHWGLSIPAVSCTSLVVLITHKPSVAATNKACCSLGFRSCRCQFVMYVVNGMECSRRRVVESLAVTASHTTLS